MMHNSYLLSSNCIEQGLYLLCSSTVLVAQDKTTMIHKEDIKRQQDNHERYVTHLWLINIKHWTYSKSSVVSINLYESSTSVSRFHSWEMIKMLLLDPTELIGIFTAWYTIERWRIPCLQMLYWIKLRLNHTERSTA